MPPSDPLRLQVADRFVTVLTTIEAGDNYFYTPHKVAKIPLDYEKAKYGNLYQVFTGEDAGSIADYYQHEVYDETFYISVIGIVHDRADLVSKVEKAVRDVRYAIDQDSKSGAAGSLGVLTVQVRIDESPMMEYFSEERDSFAQFDQKFRVHITGDIGDL